MKKILLQFTVAFFMPFVIFVGIYKYPLIGKLYQIHILHSILFLTISILALYIWYYSYNAYKKNKDIKIFVISIAFYMFGFIFFLHGIAIPDTHFVDELIFDITEHYGLFIGSFIFLIAVSLENTDNVCRHCYRLKGKILIGLNLLLAFGIITILSSHSISKILIVGIDFITFLTAILFFISILLLIRRYFVSRNILLYYLILGFAILINAGIVPFFYKEWNLLWWYFHLIILVGFIMILIGIKKSDKQEQDIEEIFFGAPIGSSLFFSFIVSSLVPLTILIFLDYNFFSNAFKQSPIITIAIVLFISILIIIISYIFSKTITDPINILAKTANIVAKGDLSKRAMSNNLLYKEIKELITDFNQMINNLEQVDKAKTEFVSLASHQLRTPLSAINWQLEELESQRFGEINEKQSKYIDRIHTESQQMINLVNSFLNVSRIEMNTFSTKPIPINIYKIIDSALSTLDKKIRDKSLHIQKDIQKDIPIFYFNPEIMQIIIENYISNAIKYSNKKDSIKITTKKEKNKLLFSVTDKGIGIPKDAQSKIFTKLYRADNAKKYEPDGNGLGLYLVKQVLKKIKGKVWFKTKENKGTTFYAQLPIKKLK